MWGVNRLRKELASQGYAFRGPSESPGLLFRNPVTGEQVRIMERPPHRYRSDPPRKHLYQYYYRYRRSGDLKEGAHIPILDVN
jgi:hypothetical protein